MSSDKTVGFGCMQLSRAGVAREHAIATLHAVLETAAHAGAALLLDTADVYAPDDDAVGHNEALVAEALASYRGERGALRVATKGGLTRPGGRWRADGRAQALSEACERSLARLGVEAIDLYLLHAVDPRTALATSVRALAKLQARGLVRAIGLCNVNVGQIEEALALAPIAAVQVSVSLLDDAALRGGVLETCRARGIELIAHSPLGGAKRVPRLLRNRKLADVAASCGRGAIELALGALSLSQAPLVAIPGSAAAEHARELIAAQLWTPDETTAHALGGAFDAARFLREPRASRRPAPSAASSAGEEQGVVLLMGYPAAGKSTEVAKWVARGYQRLNRDERGGTMAKLARALDRTLAAGARRVVLDNTFATRATRDLFIDVAWRHGLQVRCAWLDTSLEQAQINAVLRLIERHGGLLAGDALKQAGKRDPSAFIPAVQFDYRRALEPPAPDEGYAAIERVPFERRWPAHYRGKALIVELDGVLRRSVAGARTPRSVDDVALIEAGVRLLEQHAAEGYQLMATAWLPELEEGALDIETATACLARTRELLGALGAELDVRWCGHRAGPARCWCRKPLPGLGVALVMAHQLDPSRCVFAGKNSTEQLFAERLGFRYLDMG
ncbi:MAG: aldo/keto reductase [Myxococcales bacterium]|nr:aldo/keto reductase [Myxococcales bacterium]